MKTSRKLTDNRWKIHREEGALRDWLQTRAKLIDRVTAAKIGNRSLLKRSPVDKKRIYAPRWAPPSVISCPRRGSSENRVTPFTRAKSREAAVVGLKRETAVWVRIYRWLSCFVLGKTIPGSVFFLEVVTRSRSYRLRDANGFLANFCWSVRKSCLLPKRGLDTIDFTGISSRVKDFLSEVNPQIRLIMTDSIFQRKNCVILKLSYDFFPRLFSDKIAGIINIWESILDLVAI